MLKRIQNIDALNDLLPLLDEMEPEIRNRCLCLFHESPDLARQLPDTIWLAEQQSATPRWEDLIGSLRQLYRLALKWNAVTLAQGVASVIARTLHEQLSDGAAALELIGQAPNGGAGWYLLLDAQAKILASTGDPARALTLWDEALSHWSTDSGANVIGFALAARSAAIAAANMGNWAKAAQLFSQAAAPTLGALDCRVSSGLLADASHAFWRASDAPSAVEFASRAMAALASVPNTTDDVRNFYVHKAIGHLVTWLYMQAKSGCSELSEPGAGACSDLNPSGKVIELNPTPIEVSQANMLAFAQVTGARLSEFDSLACGLQAAPYSAVRMRVADVQIRDSLARGEVTALLRHIASLYTTLVTVRRHNATGGVTWIPDLSSDANPASELTLQGAEPDFCLLQLVNGLLSIAANRAHLNEALGTWRRSGKELAAPPAVSAWIDSCERLSTLDERTLFAACRSTELPWADRLAAVAIFLGRSDADPRFTLQVTADLLTLSDAPLAEHIEEWICAAVACAWRSASQRPVTLRRPSITIPPLVEACNIPRASWKKIAAIFLAAEPAVDLRIPEGLLARASRLVE